MKIEKSEEVVVWGEPFGTYIRNRRQELGFKEVDVAQYMGVRIDKFYEIEKGNINLPLNKLYALSNCLNIDPKIVINMVIKVRETL